MRLFGSLPPGFLRSRSPQVILSQFQSFTRNHAIPPHFSEDARLKELQKREKEREEGLDLYAAKHWHEIKARLEATRAAEGAFRAVDGCDTHLSTYEAMVERPSAWVKALAHFLDIPEPRPPADKIMPMATGSSIEFNRFAATYEEALVNATAKRSGLGERSIDEFSKTPAAIRQASGGATKESRVQDRIIARRQSAFLWSKADAQRRVNVNETSHTAYFYPGAHLSHLKKYSLAWLY